MRRSAAAARTIALVMSVVAALSLAAVGYLLTNRPAAPVPVAALSLDGSVAQLNLSAADFGADPHQLRQRQQNLQYTVGTRSVQVIAAPTTTLQQSHQFASVAGSFRFQGTRSKRAITVQGNPAELFVIANRYYMQLTVVVRAGHEIYLISVGDHQPTSERSLQPVLDHVLSSMHLSPSLTSLAPAPE